MKIFNVSLFLLLSFNSIAQSFDSDKVSLGNFIRRMYNSESFSGVKILQTEEGVKFMISVVEQKKDSTKSDMILNRISSLKAKSYASQYINGSNISTDVYIITSEERTKDSVIANTTMHEVFKESSYGFVDEMVLLTKFESNDSKHLIFVYYKEFKK